MRRKTDPARSRRQRAPWLGVTAAMLAAATLAGCGDGRPKRVPVSGTVLIDGKPLTYGFVRFLPKGARPATAQIDKDGRFSLSCFGDNDGVVEGTHAVVVVAAEQLGGNAQRWHAPKKYVDPQTSGLTETIDGPRDDLVIELTWSGGKPYVERIAGGAAGE
jgi:hypothetical protein